MPAKRSASHRRIGLALGSGAARGWAHIGVIEALQEAGIEPDIVCGTSIGSLVGAAYVADRLPALKRFAEDLNRRAIVGLIDVQLAGGGLLDGKHIVAALRKLGIDAAIGSYRKTFAAIATDLESGREVWLRAGPILEAVRASISLPGVLSPVRAEGQWLGDGGLVNPVPVSTCLALGADIVIAVNLNGDMVTPFAPGGLQRIGANLADASTEFINRLVAQMPAPLRQQAAGVVPSLLRPPAGTPGYFDVLTNSLNIMQDQITHARLASEPPHVLLSPRVRMIGPFEFNRAEEGIEEGRTSVAEALPEIQRLLA